MKRGAKKLENLSKKELVQAILQRDNAIATRDNTIHMLQEKLRLVTTLQYGARSERRTDDPQADLFNETENLSDEPTAEEAAGIASTEEADTETVTYERKKARGRRPLPASLPRQDIEHDIPENDKVCGCGCQKTRIGSDTSERLEYVPAKLYVERHIRHKYACPDCENGVQTAEKPATMLPKSNAGPGLLAYIVTAKYQDALPLYRQARIFERFGIDLPRQTLANWIIRCSEALTPLIDQMEQAMREVPVILMDETRLQVNKESGKAASSQSYMWIRRGLSPPDEYHPHGRDITLYHYSPSRSGDVAKRLLSYYSGALMTDGYAGYYGAAATYSLQHAQCWAHARRKFVEAEKALPKGKKSPAITAILSDIQKLYGIERKAKDQRPEEKRRQRQECAVPILNKLKASLEKKLPTITPKSKLGEAIAYTLKHWPGLTEYLTNGHIPIDNNGAENGIRPFVIGRKNWLFADTERGADASARLYSVIETAKANGLEPYHYLKYLFVELPKATATANVEKLLPWHIDPASLIE